MGHCRQAGGSALDVSEAEIDALLCNYTLPEHMLPGWGAGKKRYKMGLREMAITIGRQWKRFNPVLKAKLEARASADRAQYREKVLELLLQIIEKTLLTLKQLFIDL